MKEDIEYGKLEDGGNHYILKFDNWKETAEIVDFEDCEWLEVKYFFVIWKNINPACKELKLSAKNNNIAVFVAQSPISGDQVVYGLKTDCLLKNHEIVTGSFDKFFGVHLSNSVDWLEFIEIDGRCYVKYVENEYNSDKNE